LNWNGIQCEIRMLNGCEREADLAKASQVRSDISYRLLKLKGELRIKGKFGLKFLDEENPGKIERRIK